MINVNGLKPGITFRVKDDIFVVLNSHHSKQARGQANVKAKVKNLRTGATLTMTFSGANKVAIAHIDKQDMTYLYADSNKTILMDKRSYEQFEVANSKIEWERNFLIEGALVKARMYESELLDIELPSSVALKVTSAPDAIRGNTQSNPQKRIKVETGFELKTPMFIKEGDIILVSTSDGKYVGKGHK